MYLIKEPNGDHALVRSLKGHEHCQVLQFGVKEGLEFTKVERGQLVHDDERAKKAHRRRQAVDMSREEILEKLEDLQRQIDELKTSRDG